MSTETVKARSYTLRTETGQWLGQVVLTSDGFFSAVTDYGNLGFAWRHAGVDFREFILKLDIHYFAGKMQDGLAYIAYSGKTQKACERFAAKILPPLKAALKEEIENGIDW